MVYNRLLFSTFGQLIASHWTAREIPWTKCGKLRCDTEIINFACIFCWVRRYNMSTSSEALGAYLVPFLGPSSNFTVTLLNTQFHNGVKNQPAFKSTHWDENGSAAAWTSNQPSFQQTWWVAATDDLWTARSLNFCGPGGRGCPYAPTPNPIPRV